MWYAVSRDSGNPIHVLVKGRDLVLWKSKNDWIAFDDRCPHRGASLSLGKVKDDVLICPYHGWEYSSEGYAIRVPAHSMRGPARAKKYEVSYKYGLLWVNLDEGSEEIPDFREYYDNSFMKVECGPYLFNASPFKVVENFLDVSHFPFVHEGLLGTQETPEIPKYEVNEEHGKIIAKNIRIYQPDPDGSGRGGWENYTYEILSPYSAYFSKEGDGSRSFSIFMTVTPLEERRTLMWMIIAVNYPGDPKKMREFQDTLAEQDRKVVESIKEGQETFVSSDAIVVAYRKLLKRMGYI
jgi:phenylpropionate dioxygenase-like ring-hydroxylating dioxygenase large terminal subunit